ncbi:hypothetical protein [Mycobacterium sp. HNNTM2301]
MRLPKAGEYFIKLGVRDPANTHTALTALNVEGRNHRAKENR